jgi:hypothetical protein
MKPEQKSVLLAVSLAVAFIVFSIFAVEIGLGRPKIILDL